MSRKKITVVGAGNVGASIAAYASAEELGDVVLVDIPEKKKAVQGKALDMLEATPILGSDARVMGVTDYKATAGSDVIIITAGIARKPDQTRDQLVNINAPIVAAVAEKSSQLSPDAVMIVVSNPLDAMVYTAWKKSGFAPRKVMGMAGVLDTARFRTFLAQEIQVSVEDIQALVLGGHGDEMVPLIQYCSVGGVPITNFINNDRLETIIQRTRDGGAEIIRLLETGSAYYAPAAATVQMVESILRDKRRLIPCAAYLDGEYGEKGMFVGVPAIIGYEGVIKVVEVNLNDQDKQHFNTSVAAVRKQVDMVEVLLKQSPR